MNQVDLCDIKARHPELNESTLHQMLPFRGFPPESIGDLVRRWLQGHRGFGTPMSSLDKPTFDFYGTCELALRNAVADLEKTISPQAAQKLVDNVLLRPALPAWVEVAMRVQKHLQEKRES